MLVDSASVCHPERGGLWYYSGPKELFEEVQPVGTTLGTAIFTGEDHGSASAWDLGALMPFMFGIYGQFYVAIMAEYLGIDPTGPMLGTSKQVIAALMPVFMEGVASAYKTRE